MVVLATVLALGGAVGCSSSGTRHLTAASATTSSTDGGSETTVTMTTETTATASAPTTAAMARSGAGSATTTAARTTPTTSRPPATTPPTAAPTTAAPTTTAAPAGDATIVIANSTFQPAVVHIAVGGKITVKNTDGYSHTWSSDTGDADTWDSGNLAASGGTYTHTFTKSGTFPFHCNIHSYMTGTVTVS